MLMLSAIQVPSMVRTRAVVHLVTRALIVPKTSMNANKVRSSKYLFIVMYLFRQNNLDENGI